MHRLYATTMFAAALALTGGAYAGTVTVHGSTTVSNAVMTPHKADIERASGVTLDIVGNGSGRGLVDLAAGKADIAMISAPLDAELAAMNAKAPGSLDPAKVVGHQIGEARVAFVVHPSNSVTHLTLVQITNILSGKITRWSEVGGPEQTIVVVSAGRGDGVRSVVEDRLLGGASILAQAREMPNATQIGQVTGQLPAAFGITSAASVRPGVTVIQTDQSIGQPLILVTLGPPSAERMKVIEAAEAVATQ